VNGEARATRTRRIHIRDAPRSAIFYKLILYPKLLLAVAIIASIAEASPVEEISAQFRVELYYQASVPSMDTKPAVWTITVTKGGNLYLEDTEHQHPNLPHYNFRVGEIAADAVTLDQIPDRRGRIQKFPAASATQTTQFRLEAGKPFRISLNVPGGGPVWTITWIGPDTPGRVK
jgi:hypothetical protein